MNSFIGWVERPQESGAPPFGAFLPVLWAKIMSGKKLLRKAICERFPDNIGKYVECFGGAGWVLFYKDKHADFEVYNDINSHLVNLFRCIKHHPDAIILEMEYLLNSREIFNTFKKQDTEDLTDIQKAARYLYLIKASYGSNARTYGAKPRDIAKLDSFKDIQSRLKNVIVENKSFDALIKQYDGNDTLFYCDPPYFEAEKFYDTGNFVFDEGQHLALNRSLRNIKGKFILSYNDCCFVKGLYNEFSVEPASRQNNLASRHGADKVYKELIIKNF